MIPRCVAIAGSSGSGKSTLAVELCKRNPGLFTLVHIDDYFVSKEDAPREGEYINWDDPRCVRFEDLSKDLDDLLHGNAISVDTKSELYYPEYDPLQPKRITQVIKPAEIIILEGYLSLYNESIRSRMDFKIFLDMPIEKSRLRRSANKLMQDAIYHEKILIPSHYKYVEPTKAYADVIIDVSEKSAEEVYEEVSTLPVFKLR